MICKWVMSVTCPINNLRDAIKIKPVPAFSWQSVMTCLFEADICALIVINRYRHTSGWPLFRYQLTVTGWRHIAEMIYVKIGSGNGLLPDSTRQLHEMNVDLSSYMFCGIYLRAEVPMNFITFIHWLLFYFKVTILTVDKEISSVLNYSRLPL